ncbi:MAG: DUF2095 family protein [Candidatus Thorarchaeota archaeon]
MSKDLENYPNLQDELEKKKTKIIPLQYVCEETAKEIEEDIEKEIEMNKEMGNVEDPFRFSGYNPNAIDFIRRCDTDEQAFEIIDFLEKKEEITGSEADSLRKQIKTKGLRSFGEKKIAGFYFHHTEE